jgi:hypothetical protein
MKLILVSFRALFARLVSRTPPQPQQLDFLSTLEASGYAQEGEKLRRLSK